MANRWIVTSHKFMEHEKPDLAAAEKKRLEEKTGKPFYVYRIKTTLQPDAGELAEAEQG